MPRRPRRELSAPFFHVVNRSVRRARIFTRRTDYRAFLRVLCQGAERFPIRILAYCVMPNHWHLVIEPGGTSALIGFMHWVTATHAIRWHQHHQTVGQGPIYQGRYHSIPLPGVANVVGACRYVERNALRAGLVKRAEDWPWGSLSDRLRSEPAVPLVPARFLLSRAWIDHVNAPAPPPDGRLRDYEVDLFDQEPAPRATPGTKRARTVEISPVPLRDAAEEPGGLARRAKGAKRVVDGGRRGDKHHSHAHVERPKHLPIVDVASALQPREERRHRPAAAVK